MMTRYEFLRSLVGLGVGTLALAACGTDTGTGDPLPDANPTPEDAGNQVVDASPGAPGDAPAMACSAMSVVIGSNHGHVMTVAAADLDSTSPKAYAIQGTSSHPHTVTITPAQFAMLRANGTLMTTSSSDDGHTHTIKVTCA